VLILADDFGSGNLLLKGLGVKARFSGRLVVDPLFRGKASVLVKTASLSIHLADVESLMFNYPTFLYLKEEGAMLAKSSSFSFIDDNLNGKMEIDEYGGPFPMIARLQYGKGEILLISDSSIFINSMLEEEGNREFLKQLTRGRSVFVDISHHPASTLYKLKRAEIMLYQVASEFEIRYSIFLFMIIVFLWMRFKRKQARQKEDIEDILQRHPDWDRKTLEHILNIQDLFKEFLMK